MREPEEPDEQRYRPMARSALSGAIVTFALAAIVGLLGHASTAGGLAVLGGALLGWAAIYTVMHRV